MSEANVNAAGIPEWMWKDMNDEQKQRAIEAVLSSYTSIAKMSKTLERAAREEL